MHHKYPVSRMTASDKLASLKSVFSGEREKKTVLHLVMFVFSAVQFVCLLLVY
jgi:hypothetical protein